MGDKIQQKDWRRLEFYVPINNSLSSSDGFFIEGTAINATVTRNGTKFLPEELKKSAKTLENKPLLKDHDNLVDSIIGKVTNSKFNSSEEKVDFKARVLDEKIIEKIQAGLINSVSVGAMVKDIEFVEDEGGNFEHAIVRGIEFVELSLVAVPADPNAGFSLNNFACAITESMDLKKEYLSRLDAQKKEQSLKKEKEEQIMVEENNVSEELKAEKLKNESMEAELKQLKEERVAKLAEEKLAAEKAETDRIEAKEVARVKELADKDAEITALKEAAKVIEDKPPVKEAIKMKGKVNSNNNDNPQENNIFEGYNVVKSGNGKIELSVASYNDKKNVFRLNDKSDNAYDLARLKSKSEREEVM